jgi:hypothetical protein
MNLNELKDVNPDKLTKEELEQRIMKSIQELNEILETAHARIDKENTTRNR